MQSVVPKFSETSDTGSIKITHCEYIRDVYSGESSTFESSVFNLQPGDENTFPWLSQLAVNYQEYEIKQCIFTFESTVTDVVSTSGPNGIISAVPLYSQHSKEPESNAEMMNTQGVGSGNFSKNLLIGVECDVKKIANASKGGKLIRRQGQHVSNVDDYDHGKLVVGTSGAPTTLRGVQIGGLWVSYTVVLRRPRIFVSAGLNIQGAEFCINQTHMTPVVGTAPFMFLGASEIIQTFTSDASQVLARSENSIDGIRLDHALPMVIGNAAITWGDIDGSMGYAWSGDLGATTACVARGLLIEFPTSFTGPVEITLSIRSRKNPSISKNDRQDGYCAIGRRGNVHPINDIPTRTNNGRKFVSEAVTAISQQAAHDDPGQLMHACFEFVGGGREVYTEEGGSDAGYFYEMHCRVHAFIDRPNPELAQPRSGVTISPALFSNMGDYDFYSEAWNLKVTEYNVGDLTSGVPKWINSVGQEVQSQLTAETKTLPEAFMSEFAEAYEAPHGNLRGYTGV